jgi:ligand-binding sensor domain-containing protein
MKPRSAKWLRIGLATGTLVVFALAAVFIAQVRRVLRSASDDVQALHSLRFTVQPWSGFANTDFESISAPAVFAQAALFQGNLYVAGPSGLLEFDARGNALNQYAVGRDLPASPLVAMVTATLADSHVAELIIGTAKSGLLAFNGQSFREITPEDLQARSITALAGTSSGQLLIGTEKLGVLAYDGKRLSPLHPTLQALHVTAFSGDESDLWVGTLAQGVLHYHAGVTERFSEAEGLPDPQVLAITSSGDSTYVGTPLGVALFRSGRFSRVLAAGVFATALLAKGSDLYVGTEDEGILTVSLAGARPNAGRNLQSGVREVHQIVTAGDDLLAVARDGVYRKTAAGLDWRRTLQSGRAALSDRNISALATDEQGRVWVGYFDRGVDILSADHARSTHIEDEHLFCVNRILMDPKADGVDVATANGLVRFNKAGTVQQVLTRTDGLIADHVTDVAAYRDGLAVATPAGLTFLDASGARSLYAFHGLVNNHVYALGVEGDELMAGTLGGLSELEKAKVTTNYTIATSNLPHNWITAVVRAGSSWMVGTYGAGVVGLDASGRFHSFDKASGHFEVNPNAMLVTPTHVLAGSMGEGLYVYDRESGRWWVIDRGLPSLNVTAVAAGGGYLYVGTDNGLVRISEHKLHL